jgi:hypothetical protein
LLQNSLETLFGNVEENINCYKRLCARFRQAIFTGGCIVGNVGLSLLFV